MPAPGRPYTMAEMKMIVDYLVEHKLYREVKARKMWQDFARTGKVNRTWQSLKETFLKRILPDIHNNYYKLTPAQKRSFKESCDVEARESKNRSKLEMQQTPNDNSSSKGDSNDNQRASCSKETGKHTPDTPSMIITRSQASTDTVILENNYETAEQILMDLESNEDKENSDEPQSPSRTLRDYITYSEPLTPMLQEVLDDFATDEDEPKLQIVEDYEPTNGNENSDELAQTIRRSERLSPTKPLSRKKQTQQKKNNGNEGKRESQSVSPSISKVKTLKLKKTRKGREKKSNKDQGSPSKTENGNDDNIEKIVTASVTKEINKTVDKDGTNLTDTQLPNNQEQLGNNVDGKKSIDNDKQTSIEGSTEEFQDPKKKKPVKRPRSASSLGNNKKLRKDTQPEIQEIKKQIHETNHTNIQNDTQVPALIVDTQTYDSHPNIVANKTLPENQNGTFNSHDNQEKLPCTSTQPDQSSQNDSTNNKVSETNPCLQSISLYAEQFCTKKYSDSEHGDEIAKEHTAKKTTNKKEQDYNDGEKSNESNNSKTVQETNNNNSTEHSNNAKNLPQMENNDSTQVESENKIDDGESESSKIKDTVGKSIMPFTQDVVVLKSKSESDQSHSPVYQEGPNKFFRGNKSRDEALANVFGFASGAVTLTTVSKRGGKVTVNPKYRHSSKRRTLSKNGYFRPHLDSASSDNTSSSESEDISQFRDYIPPKSYNVLSHKGAKFVTDGHKVYPLLMSKNNKLYYTYGSDEDREEETDSHWKAKYMEERKRVAEEKIRADELARLLKCANEKAPRHTRSKSPMMSEISAKRKCNDKEDTIDVSSDTSKCSITTKDSEKTVKIKFNDKKEIELECGLSYVPSVLEKMVSMFQHKDEAKQTENTLQVEEKHPRTPTPEITRKVNRIESEIFKEIAEKDALEKSSENNVANTNDKEEIATTNDVANSKEKNTDKNVKVGDENVTVRKRGRPKKTISVASTKSPIAKPEADKPSTPDAEMPCPAVVEREPLKRIPRVPKKKSEVEAMLPISGRSRSKLSLPGGRVHIPDDPNFKYKFNVVTRSQSDTETTKRNITKYLTPSSRFLSPDHDSRLSGYVDTDSSPSPPRKKKSISLGRSRNKNKRNSYSHPYHGDVDTCDSQRSQTPEKIERNSPNKQSSPNTSVYRSDSFQLLMPIPRAKSVPRLDKIDENSSDVKSVDTQIYGLSPISVKVNDQFDFAPGSRNENNSSNISLISPEISVVEKLHVSKEMILFNSSAEVPTYEHTQVEGMETTGQSTGNHMIPDVDVGLPTIEQNCNVQETAMSVSGDSIKSVSVLKSNMQTEFEEQSSYSLDERLRDLFLESAKKIQMQERHLNHGNSDNMNIDQIMATVKKARGKRSSTPQKKRRSTKSTDATPGPVIIEHVESCSKSKGGRRSCPPVINVIECISPPRSEDESAVEPVKKGRRQKDLIKVKIQRPKDKSLLKERRARSASRMSVCSDSGINDTGRTESDAMRSSDDSVQLIHNHSETCLQANECIRYESLLPSKQSHDVGRCVKSPQDIFARGRGYSNNDIENLLCDDALDATEFVAVPPAARQSQGPHEATSPSTSVPSTLSYGSLMTDDLSDESPKKSEWRLMSEDETNPDELKPHENSAGNCFSHSNLRQLFTGYTIPDLSIISEGSREDSSKPK